MEYITLLQKILFVSFTIVFFWKLIKYMWSFLNIEKEPVTVLVTGAAGMFKSIILDFSFTFVSFHGFDSEMSTATSVILKKLEIMLRSAYFAASCLLET